jgi:hypothetical protein
MPMTCPHEATPVWLPGGTRILGSGQFDRTSGAEIPDFGLYAYEGWRPTWPSAFIDWVDFGLPLDTPSAYRLIVDAFDRARGGQLVEVGCHAGNGRTGCMIACMAILAGTPASEAVEWTRSHYCLQAIDTSEQERWVEAFTPA